MSHTTAKSSTIDLHVHTTASDGTLCPGEVVRQAAACGIAWLGVTDHDSTAGLDEAIAEAERLPEIQVIPGVELSATAREGGDLHLLGYCIDPDSSELQGRLNAFRRERQERVYRIVERLRDAGVPITIEQVADEAGDGAVSRAHIGRVLIELGEVDTIGDAFNRWLGRGRPAFVPRPPLMVDDAIAMIRAAGGVSVLAHPLTMGRYERQLPEMLEAGLDGLECYYGPYSEEERQGLAAIARKLGLIATGGSDFHGPDHREGRELGGVYVPYEVLYALRSRAPDCC